MTSTTITDTCGNCATSLTQDDKCGYGGHDLNELFKDNLPEDAKYRCCDCLSDLTGEACGQSDLDDNEHLWLWVRDNADLTHPGDTRALATLAELLGGGYCEACKASHPGRPHSRD